MKTKKINLDTLSKVNARIAIAKDVLAQLKAKTFRAESGTYCHFIAKNNKLIFRQGDVEQKRDMQDILKKRMHHCNVCAKGALFVSMVRKYDAVPVTHTLSLQGRYLSGNFVTSYLNQYFSKSQLQLIERTFENIFNGRDYDPPYGPVRDKRVMVSIMQNLVDNKGTFVPQENQ